jgi:hypothetical protein
MGDPTLRAIPKSVAAVGTITASTEFPNKVNLSWTKPSGNVDAFTLYRRKQGVERWTLLTPRPITSTAFRDSLKNEGTLEYMVRACALRSTASGTYYDMGKGATCTVLTTGVTEDVPVVGSVIASVQPNPASDNVGVEFSITRPGQTTVDLYDITGRSIARFDAGVIAAGTHRTTFDVSSLPPGTYTLTVKGPAESTSISVMVVR